MSVELYLHNVLTNIGPGWEAVCFGERDPIPADADLIWDPAATGARAPYPIFQRSAKPAVITVHGAAPLTLPARELYRNRRQALTGYLLHRRRVWSWRRLARPFDIITVSAAAKHELVVNLGLNPEVIVPIHHGVDHSIFRPPTEPVQSTSFLYVGLYQPKKNVERVLEAYRLATLHVPMGLTIVCPGFPARRPNIPGVRWYCQRLDHRQLAREYQRATALLFPSLHESFGLPIVEAMACGCPVVTANQTACPEIAGQAALLVDPRSVDAIRRALEELAERQDLREELRTAGLRRAADFTWTASARTHESVFRRALVHSDHD